MKTLPRPRAAPGGSARAYPSSDVVLGRYRLLEQIGSGGHGTVWIARDQERRQLVAVKRIPCRHDDPQEQARIEREGRAAARLEHPAIVALFDSGEDAGAHYLVSELVQGSSLAKLYRAGGVADRELLEIGSALAAALEHAHERGVVHRDVKPQNVIVPQHPAAAPAKLADFGIARLAGEHPLTVTGDVIGTFEYMAPEQAQGRTAGPRADLYSLALTLYEGFAGANPLRGETVAATALRLGGEIEPLANLRGDLAPELCAAIDRALAPAPTGRGTLAQLRAALDGALHEPPPRRPHLGALGRGSRLAPAAAGAAAPIALTPRARRLLNAAAAGSVGGIALTAVLAPHAGPQAGVLAGACLAALVLLSPAVGWLLAGLAAVGWLGAAGAPGSALVLIAALAPVPALLPSRPWLWSAPAIGPALGVLGLAACAPVFAARLGSRAPARAALGMLSYWWLAIAEALTGRRLLFGAPAAVGPRSAWQGSFGSAVQHALVPLASDGRLLTAALWGFAAVLLPWLVRAGARMAMRAAGALAWATLLVGAGAWVASRVGSQQGPSPWLAGALAAVLALLSASWGAHSHRSGGVA
ncbi:MAG: serine/threonine-protein kinase [Solirubrobacteraceae bacterium]